MIKIKAGVIARHQGRVLLIRELNRCTGRYKWNMIKGTFEPAKDASILDRAIREAWEEAGARIKLKYFLSAYYLRDGRDALMTFVFVADLVNKNFGVLPKTVQAKYGEDTVIKVKLFTKKELLQLKPPDFIGQRGYLAVREYLTGTKYPLRIVQTLPPQ